MGRTNHHEQAPTPSGGPGSQGSGVRTAVVLTGAQVWREVDKASFAVLSHVTPSGEPRSSGIVYKAVRGHLYVAVAPTSWKARQISTGDRIAMTVLVRRGGMLSLVLPIPPATISFRGTVVVHAADAPEVRPLLAELKALLPSERAESACLIEIAPEGEFLTYGVGVALMTMRDPQAARARVSVS